MPATDELVHLGNTENRGAPYADVELPADVSAPARG
jgi:hypothetical protein